MITEFQQWLKESYKDKTTLISYIEIKSGRRFKKIPLFEETLSLPINLKSL